MIENIKALADSADMTTAAKQTNNIHFFSYLKFFH